MKYFFTITIFFVTYFVQAQVQILENQNPEFNVGVLYDREFVMQGSIHTNGFNIGFMKGKIKKYYKTTFYHADLGFLKHARESSTTSSSSSGLGFGSFVYGKQNTAIIARVGYGMKRFFSEKASQRGVAVGFTIEGGPALAILKPYLLEYNYFDPEENKKIVRTIQYSESTREEFLDVLNIKKNASFFKGIEGTNFVPGAHFKISAHFDWGAFDAFVKAMDVGLMVDVYIKKLEIMVPETEDNQSLFLNFFVDFQFGKRW